MGQPQQHDATGSGRHDVGPYDDSSDLELCGRCRPSGGDSSRLLAPSQPRATWPIRRWLPNRPLHASVAEHFWATDNRPLVRTEVGAVRIVQIACNVLSTVSGSKK